MYGFIVPNAGRDLITSLLAGEQLILTRCMVGTGQVPAEVQPTTLTDLVQPIAQATSTEPLVKGNRCCGRRLHEAIRLFGKSGRILKRSWHGSQAV